VPRGFWRDWSAALEREFPDLTRLGEMWHGDPALSSYFQGGRARDGIDTGIEALFDFPLFYALRRAFVEGKPLREAAELLARDFLYPDPTRLVTFVGLHDVPRFMGEPAATRDGPALALTLIMTTRGIPMLYYGDEIGMPGGGDPDNRRDFPGGWPGDAPDAFSAAGRTPEQEALVAHVARLTRLRRELPALARGGLRHLLVEEQRYAFGRTLDGRAVVVAFNNAAERAELELPVAELGLAEGSVLEDRLGAAGAAPVAGGRLRVRIAPRSAAVLAPRRGARQPRASARPRSTAAVAGSAGKKVSSASSESVMSTGVPKTVVVLMNDRVPASLARRSGTRIPAKPGSAGAARSRAPGAG
jgi:hypothetical protein